MEAGLGVMEDHRGASHGVTDHTKLTRWNVTDVPEYAKVEEVTAKPPAFPYDEELNRKVVLWSGDLTSLNTDAIVHSTNESFADRNPVADRIMLRAGPDLAKDIKNNVKVCRTGDAKITKGFGLPARYIIHTVGPRYNLKYQTAADNALYNCYRNTLQIVREKQISSVAFCCVHSTRRDYPTLEGGHIALRTVRRFLEKYGNEVITVIFVVLPEEEDAYISLMPLYFPRTLSEERYAVYHLPDDIGNESGEPIIKERQIRIMGKPTHEALKFNWKSPEDLEESININEAFETSVAVGAHSFSQMDEDIDKKRRLKLHYETHIALLHKEQYIRYERWLKRARQEDLCAIEALRCFYQSGFDIHGQPVVIFIGRNFPATKIDLDKFTLYVLLLMDTLVNKKYVVVYFHTDTQPENHLDKDYLRSLYNLLDSRYRKNLGALYIVHPTFWSKVVTWFFATFNAADMKPLIHSIQGLEYLYKKIPMDQLDLPAFITDYDIKVNGTRYYNPDSSGGFGVI